jgi:hypothetical protein
VEDALIALQGAKRTASELESIDAFQSFTTSQKNEYRDVRRRFRDLIHDS